MAKIAVALREDDTQPNLENGRAGVGALKIREMGYSEAVQEFSFRNNANQIRRLVTKEKLASVLGAALIGLDEISGMSADNLQQAIAELYGIASGASGGTIGGSAAAGSIPVMATVNTLMASYITQAVGQILVDASLHAEGTISTNQSMQVQEDIVADGDAQIGGEMIVGLGAQFADDFSFGDSAVNNLSAFQITSALTKANSNVRNFSVLSVKPTIFAGAGNANTLLSILDLDYVGTSLIGTGVDLFRASADGVLKASLDNQGHLGIVGGFESYGLGAPRAVNYEYLAMRHLGGSGAEIHVGAGGTGELRELFFDVGGSRKHVMEPDGTVGLGRTSGFGGSLHLGPNAAGICAVAFEASADPDLTAAPIFYYRNNKMVFAYNNGTIDKYWSLDMTSTSNQTLNYTTTPP